MEFIRIIWYRINFLRELQFSLFVRNERKIEKKSARGKK